MKYPTKLNVLKTQFLPSCNTQNLIILVDTYVTGSSLLRYTSLLANYTYSYDFTHKGDKIDPQNYHSISLTYGKLAKPINLLLIVS